MKAVVTLGKYFGPKHPRKGQETGFIAKVTDGLTVDDFKAWFAPIFAETDKKYPQFAGLASAVTIDFAIIHFTKRRY